MSDKTKKVRPHLVYYGNQRLIRTYCEDCGGTCFVLSGHKVCCGMPNGDIPEFVHQETEAERKRKKPTVKDQKKVLDAQGWKCLYCDREFGSYAGQNPNLCRLEPCWDHFVPFSYMHDNYPVNFVASCQICNSIKSDHLFRRLDEAIEYITAKRIARGDV